MIGTVQELGRTQKGSAKLKIDGQWYFAGRCKVDAIQVGHQIDFTWSPFGEGNKFKGLDAWGFVGQSTPTGGQSRQAPAEAPIPKPDPNYLDEPSLRFISNVVGSAITSGAIKDATEVTKWTLAGKEALGALKGNLPVDFDRGDKIPF